MPKISFIFIAAAFLTLPLEEIQSEVFERVEAIFCLTLIASFGVAHGAIDNHLYGFRNLRQNLSFIAYYVLAAVGFALLWYWQIDLAFLLFMLISAFHFGQSQLVEAFEDHSLLNRALYTLWGTWLLSAYLFLNRAELIEVSGSDLEKLSSLSWLLEYSAPLFFSSGTLLVLSLLGAALLKKITYQYLLIELYQALLITAVFYLASSLWSFTLYFVILHSGRVLQQEFQYLLASDKIKSVTNFIKMLSPFTLLSIFGLAFIIALFYFFELEYSWTLLSLIFISCLTFPHSFVMDRFYQKSL